jgi:LacI family transcriptional regulator
VEAGLLTVVCCSGRSPELELKNVAMLRQARVAAVLFAGGSMADAEHERRIGTLAREIRSYGGAVVALARRSERWPSEVCDNRRGAAMGARHLLDLGHRQIAMIVGPRFVWSSQEREAGYRGVLSAARVEWGRTVGDFTSEGGQRAAAKLLNGPRPFSAVLVANDAMAMGVLAELRRQRVSVPGEVSVIGFGDVPAVRYLSPSLTTIRVPVAEMAAAGVRRALDILEGRGSGPRVQIHPVELVVRESTAAVPADRLASLPADGIRQPAIAPR